MMGGNVSAARVLSVAADLIERLLPEEPVYVEPVVKSMEDSLWANATVWLDFVRDELKVSEEDLADWFDIPRGGVGQACAHLVARFSCDGCLDRDLPMRVGYAGLEAGDALRQAAHLLGEGQVSREAVVEAAARIRGAAEVVKVRAAWPYRWIVSWVSRDGDMGYFWEVNFGGHAVALAWPQDVQYALDGLADPSLLDEEDREGIEFGRALLAAQEQALKAGQDHLVALRAAAQELIGGEANGGEARSTADSIE